MGTILSKIKKRIAVYRVSDPSGDTKHMSKGLNKSQTFNMDV